MNQSTTLEKEKWDELGKLYLFPVDNPELKSKGIQNQWFLTHQEDDHLFAGHINDRGEWSLCEEKDLTPTYNYQSVDRIWELLSNASLMKSPKSLTKGQTASRSDIQKLHNTEDDSDNNEETIQVDYKKKPQVNVGKIPFASHNRDFYLELDDEELIAYEKKEKKLARLQEEEDLLDFAPIEFVSPEVTGNIATESISEVEEKQAITITATERDLLEPVVHWGNHQDHTGSLLESDLQTLLWHGFKEDLLDVENQDSDQPWLIELEEDTGYIKLISSEDYHTVISIAQDGTIVEGLSLEDADLLMDGLISTNQERDQQNKITLPKFELNIKQKNQEEEWEI